jgi:hypothetical protein
MTTTDTVVIPSSIREVNMKNLNISNVAIARLVLLISSLVAGCGSGTAPVQPSHQSSPTATPAPLNISVTISPSSVGIQRSGTWSFGANVVNSTNAAVMWSIQENSAGGAISDVGVYTAPAVDGVYHVVATAQADPTKNAIATVNVVKSGFRSTGSLSQARLRHTATLLPNGKVLVAGGGYGPDLVDGYWVADRAELFDPTTGSFSSAGVVSRDGHTAALLLDGDVLLAGGETGWSDRFPIVSGTADLERATSGLFEPTGNMFTERESHAAVLLSDGQVLVTGGVIPSGISWQALQEAELYDPGSGTFATVAKMNVARAGHTVTLLPNGKVLIAGGGYQGGGDTAELFEPATGSFTLTGRMSAARSSHTATLLPNGKVLIAGGGQTAELYDPVTGLFTPTGSMATPRFWHTATMLPDGTVLVAGGSMRYWGSETATTEIYDPATGSFSPGPSMRQGRFSHTATLLPGGRILFVGGASSSDGIHITALASAEIYN